PCSAQHASGVLLLLSYRRVRRLLHARRSARCYCPNVRHVHSRAKLERVFLLPKTIKQDKSLVVPFLGSLRREFIAPPWRVGTTLSYGGAWRGQKKQNNESR
ncbi:unnamed protein product, partial [Ectocarpus sp. 12 AP-2014]